MLLWSSRGVVLLLSDSLTRVRRPFVTTPFRLFASGHSFIMSNQEFVDQRLTGQDLWHVAGPCFLLRRFTHLVSTYQLQSCHMAIGVLFSVSNLFIKKLWSTVILSHFNALTLLDAQHFLLLTFIKRGWQLVRPNVINAINNYRLDKYGKISRNMWIRSMCGIFLSLLTLALPSSPSS